MRNRVAILLGLALVAALAMSPHRAIAQVSLTLGSTSLAAGESGGITATIATDGSAVALQFDVLYDPALLSLGTVNGGAALTANHSIASNPIGPGRDRIVVTSAPVTALSNGDLAFINLSVIGGSPAGTTPVNFDGVVISDAAAAPIVPSALNPGAITVTASPVPTGTQKIPASPLWSLLLMILVLVAIARHHESLWRGVIPSVAATVLLAISIPLVHAQSIPGDANGDGRLDAEDVELIVERILERGVLPGDGDCNRDTTINVLDTVCSQIPFVPGETDPIILGPGDRSIPAAIPFAMNLFAADPDSGATQSWELVSGPSGLNVGNDGLLTWTPGAGDIGDNGVSVRVTDDTARTDESDFTISVFTVAPVAPANSPPVLTVPDDQALLFNTTLSVSVSGADADGDDYSFALMTAPAGMVIDPDSGAVSWTPGEPQIGDHDVSVSVTDEYGAVDFGSFVVTVLASNEAPVARDDLYEARLGVALNIPAEGVLGNDSDPNGDTLNAVLESYTGPADLTLNSDGSLDYLLEPADPTVPVELELLCANARSPADYDNPDAVESRYQANETLIVGDVDGDGTLEVIGAAQLAGRTFMLELWMMNATDCTDKFEFDANFEDTGTFDLNAQLGLHDIDGDGDLEIIGPRERFPIAEGGNFDREHLLAVHHDGSIAWPVNGGSETSTILSTTNGGSYTDTGATFSDIDGNGTTEIVMATQKGSGVGTFAVVVVYDGADGSILWEYESDIAQSSAGPRMPYIVDLDLDGTMEIIAHNSVIDHEGNREFILPSVIFPGTTPEGNLVIGIGNFDDDAYPELVARDARNYYMFEHDGTLVWEREQRSDHKVSQIAVADFDGDGALEFADIGCTEYVFNCVEYALQVFEADGSLLWDHSALPEYHFDFFSAGGANPTAWDANRDGAFDIVVRNDTVDELFIFDGSDGTVLTSVRAPDYQSRQRYVTIVDVDGDGHAELINSHTGGIVGETEIWTGSVANPLPSAPNFRHQWFFSEAYVNDDLSVPAEPLPHWLTPGLNGWNMLKPEPNPFIDADDRFTYVANDGDLDSAPATVTLDVLPAGNPPQFLTPPDATATRNFAYLYEPIVYDPDLGDVVSFQLMQAPGGMTINSATGAIQWLPDALGSYPVTILATDTIGFAVQQSWDLVVGEQVTVPDVVGLEEGNAENDISGAGLAVGGKISMHHPTSAAGTVYEQEPAAGSIAEFGATVRLYLSLGPGPLFTDDDGDGFSENDGDCDDEDRDSYPGAPDADGDGVDQDCDGLDGSKTIAAIEVSPASKHVLTDERVNLTATAIFVDGTAQDITGIATWSDGPGFSAGSAGSYSPQASLGGISGSAAITVVARVAEDQPPVAQISSPTSGDPITAPTDIVGTATDANLLRWELAYQYAGEDEFVLIAEGSDPVSAATFASFDPTTLLNGLYTVRLRVYDAGGNLQETSTTTQIEGQLKVGNFTLNYVDLELPLSGIPIKISREYDSRDKRSGEFGVGWRLGINSLEIRTNRELGTGWQVLRSGLAFQLVETDVHIAALRLPGGHVEAFEMVVSPLVSPLIPFPPLTQSVSFRPLPGTLGTLQSLEENNVSILDPQPGAISLRKDSDGSVYNPTLFRYTAPDGTKLDLDTQDGIQRVESPGGQTLTFSPTSIEHSNGILLDLERDDVGRIFRITDPGGFSQSYSYDANGDLRSHTDQEGFVTRFDYDGNHNLIRVTDPLGRLAARNEYDDQGRLISSTDTNGNTTLFDHEVGSRLERVTDAAGFVTVLEYDDRGNVIRITDPLGGVATATYDDRGNALSQTNAEGETTTFTYDTRNNLLTETDPEGFTQRFSYDSRDRLSIETDALGRETRYEYGETGRITRITDPLGNSRDITLDSAGNLLAESDEAGRVSRFEYDARGYQTAVVDPRGHTLIRTYDANGNVLSRTDAKGGSDTLARDGRGYFTEITPPSGDTMHFGFNGTGELLTATDAAGNRVNIVEDAAGNVLRVEDPAGGVTQHFYDSRNLRTRTVDPSGREIRFQYDALERRTHIVFEDGGTTETTYDAVGRALSEIDPDGNVTTYEYDDAGRNTAVTDALGNRTEFSYDAVGNIRSRLDARGNRTDYTYDDLDRLIAIDYPNGTSEEFAYDAVGNLLTETDRLGRIKSYTYDESDNIKSVIETDGGTTTYTYDENNNRISQADAKGQITRFVYDSNDRLIEKRYPDGSNEQYVYDAGGRIARTILPDGKYIDASRDGSGRTLTHDLNGESSESFTYDDSGRLIDATNLWGTLDYTYDADGRIEEIRSEGGNAVRYAYDSAGNRTSISTQLAGEAERVTGYAYDALNRLESVVEPDGETTTYAYDPVGNVESITYPNGVVSNFVYDDLNQLRTIEHRQGVVVLAAYDYTLDDGGRRLRVDHAGGDSVSYSYDEADRLLQETHRNAANVVVFEQTFSYDAVGNRLTQQIAGQAQTELAYDSADKLLTMGVNRFSYDANGRLIARTTPLGTISYRWDVESQLLQITTSAGTVRFAYDANGKRRRRAEGAQEQNFLFDEASMTGYDQTLLEFDETDTQRAEYVWGDRLISANDGAADFYYHADGSHNIRLLSDDDGAIADGQDYDAFGNSRVRLGATGNPFAFAGEWGSDELVYLRARFYDPSVGRFITRDPFAGTPYDPVSLHRYLYANANPIMYRDPSGQTAVSVSDLMWAIGISVTVSVVSDLIQGADAKTIIANAVIAAVLAPVGLGLGAKIASKFAGVAAGATRKGLVYAAIVFSKAGLNTALSLSSLIASDIALGKKKSSVSGPVAIQLFTINVLAEVVTLGIFKPKPQVLNASGAARQNIGDALSDSQNSIRKTARGILNSMNPGDDAVEVLQRLARKGPNATRTKFAKSQLALLSDEALKILRFELTEGATAMFSTPGIFNSAMETSKKAMELLWDWMRSK